MGRLFWKIIVAFWLAFAAISITIGGTLWVLRQTHSESVLWGGWEQRDGPSGIMLDTASAILTDGSVATLRSTINTWISHNHGHGAVLYVTDDHGRELLGRKLPPLGPAVDVRRSVRSIKSADGHVYTLYLYHQPRPLPPVGVPGFMPAPQHVPPPPAYVPIISALFVSLGFSAWLACRVFRFWLA